MTLKSKINKDKSYNVGKVFDLSTQKGLQNAERYKNTLHNKYDYVEVKMIGFNKVKITGISNIKI